MITKFNQKALERAKQYKKETNQIPLNIYLESDKYYTNLICLIDVEDKFADAIDMAELFVKAFAFDRGYFCFTAANSITKEGRALYVAIMADSQRLVKCYSLDEDENIDDKDLCEGKGRLEADSLNIFKNVDELDRQEAVHILQCKKVELNEVLNNEVILDFSNRKVG